MIKKRPFGYFVSRVFKYFLRNPFLRFLWCGWVGFFQCRSISQFDEMMHLTQMAEILDSTNNENFEIVKRKLFPGNYSYRFLINPKFQNIKMFFVCSSTERFVWPQFYAQNLTILKTQSTTKKYGIIFVLINPRYRSISYLQNLI